MSRRRPLELRARPKCRAAVPFLNRSGPRCLSVELWDRGCRQRSFPPTEPQPGPCPLRFFRVPHRRYGRPSVHENCGIALVRCQHRARSSSWCVKPVSELDPQTLSTLDCATRPAPNFIPPGRVMLLQQLPAEAMTLCCPAGLRSACSCSGIPWRIGHSRGHGQANLV